MKTTRATLVAVVCVLTASCSGDKGRRGADGPAGPQGPVAVPPVLGSISPNWGSANTHVTLLGENFSAIPGDNQIYFDGHAATVLSATPTQLVVMPGLAVGETTPTVVSVEVANQVSNGVFFRLVPSGTAGALDIAVPTAPTATVEVGTDLYIAAGISVDSATTSLPSAGLYRMAANGTVTRVLRAVPVEAGGGLIMDGPVALASDGTDVYFTTTFGAVRRYQPATGQTTEILAPGPGGGPAFPSRTGLAFGVNGVNSPLYIVDRNFDQGGGDFGAVLVLYQEEALGVITNALFAGGSSTSPGIFGIAADDTNVWVTNEFFGEVLRLNTPFPDFLFSNPTTVDVVADGAVRPRGIALVDDDVTAGIETVVVADPNGELLSAAMNAIGAVLAPFGDPAGYLYASPGLTVNAAGDLLLAQPAGSCVRRLPAGDTVATIIVAGLRPGFASARIGASTYLATFGPVLFGGGPSIDQPDGAILEITDAGATRILATSTLPTGLVASGAGELTVSECIDARIFTLDIATGSQTDRLLASDGLTCPAGLALDSSGTLFYLNSDLGGLGPSTVGKLTSAGALTADFVVGFANSSIYLQLTGSTLVATSVGPSSSGFAIESASTAGGTAGILVSAPASGQSAVVTAPDGRAFAVRTTGDIFEIDVAGGTLVPFGTVLLPGTGPAGGSYFSAAFLPDGTMIIPHLSQGLTAVTP